MNSGDLWAPVHIDQKNLRAYLEHAGSSFDSDIGWLHYLTYKTPNGRLLLDNNLFRLESEKKIYLGHVTSNLDMIRDTGRLLSSSGCLVGSVYCTPLFKEGNRFRLHNLGSYIYTQEAPKFSNSGRNIALLIIELDFAGANQSFPIGVDYLRMGQIHFSVFSELNYLLSQAELEELHLSAVKSIKDASVLFQLADEFSTERLIRNFDKFYKLYQGAILNLPILGYFLFEVLCEYIALFQRGKEVDLYHSLGELYCANFKNIIFSACPELTKSFNLGLFHPDLSRVENYLKKIDILNTDVDRKEFEIYLLRRLHFLINDRFYVGRHDGFWRHVEWNFSYLERGLAPLLGHTIHRFMRNMHRYPNFYFYFDQYKALQAWNYWNHANIALPYNALLPKGEIGINPANPYLKYRIFNSRVSQEGDLWYVEPGQEFELVIEPRLAELNHLLMRKK